MRLFSRNQEAAEAHGDEAAFDSLRRSARSPRRTRVVADGDQAAPLDPAQATRTRARRRLIGAVALALAAIVFVPMLFDRAPVAPSDDIALQIPDRDTPFEGRRGVPDPARGPLRAAPEPTPAVVEAPPTVAAEPAITAPAEKTGEPPVAKSQSTTKATEKQAEKSPERPPEKQSEKQSEKQPEKQSATIASADDPRALAALEGKSAVPAAEPAGDRSYAVQVAAFSAADKARGLRDQLVSNGLRSYTESVSTAQGQRTRVRLGPFASRDAADRAKQKLKTMKLDGSVVPL